MVAPWLVISFRWSPRLRRSALAICPPALAPACVFEASGLFPFLQKQALAP
jgi:hypothetical protein